MNRWRNETRDAREETARRLLEKATDVPLWDGADKAAVWRRVQQSAHRGSGARARVTPPMWLALTGSLAFFVFAWVHTQVPGGVGAALAHLPGGHIVVHPFDGSLIGFGLDWEQGDSSPRDPTAARDWTPVDLGAIGKLRVRPTTVYEVPSAPATPGSGYRIALQSGELCAEIVHRDVASDGPLLVEAPYAKVFVVGTRFCVSVHDEESTVSVTEGRVRVETATGTAFVSTGETLASNDPRLQTPAAAARPAGLGRSEPPTAQPTPTLPLPASPAPLPTVPPVLAPTSLAEQNALYARGVQARDRHDGAGALAAWRAYLSQFPKGVLAPEASQGILAELVAEKRDADAMVAADEYLRTFPGDGRAAEVAFIRGNILREKSGRASEALAAYQDALRLATRPALRDDALFAVGACQQKLGLTAEARATFQRYRREFPTGTHAAEMSK